MRNVATLLLFAIGIAGAAQKAAPAVPPQEPAPPGVDATLRDRVTKFFQAQMNGKYRQAEPYVAEDTKDYFYVMPKIPVLSFEITRISYSDKFTKAVVDMSVERSLKQGAFPEMKLKMQQSYNWKIEDGLWCWTFDPNAVPTPFGNMHLSADNGGAGSAPEPTVPSVVDMTRTVAADRSEIELGDRRTDQVLIRNFMPAAVKLSLEVPPARGLQVTLDHPDVGPKGTAHVLFNYDPTARGAHAVVAVVAVVVAPTSQVIRIRVKLTPAAGSAK